MSERNLERWGSLAISEEMESWQDMMKAGKPLHSAAGEMVRIVKVEAEAVNQEIKQD